MSVMKTVDPNDQVGLWLASSLVTVDCNIVNQELIKNSIEITGQIVTNRTASLPGQNGGAQFNGAYLKLDPLVGAHGLFSEFSQSTELLQRLPSNSDYPRWVKQYRYSNMDKSSLSLLGKEMCGPTDDFTFYEGMTFKVKPMIMLNSSNVNLSCEKIGNSFRLEFWLPSVSRLFSTDNTNANFTYALQNLRIHYKTQPSQGYKGAVVFDTYHAETPSLVTGSQTFSNAVSNLDIKNISMSFQSQANSQLTTVNPMQFDNIGVTQVSFQMNDLINGITSFNLTKNTEIGWNGLSLNRNGYTKFYPDGERMNTQIDLIGVKFSSMVDAATNKISINVQSSNPTNLTPYLAHIMYEGVRVY